MEFLKPNKRKTLVSETVYVIMNILLAIGVLALVHLFESPLPAFALILLSKWRVLAVRPHFWAANIIANAIDIILGLSFVVYLLATDSLAVQIGLTILYIGWLLLLKPKSKRRFVVLQAALGLFFGVGALMHISYGWIASLVVLAMWIIGYASARHVLTAYKEPHFSLLSLIWAFIIAELGWIAYHWTIVYDLQLLGGLKLPQIALIVLFLGFLAERTYASYHAHKTVRLNDVLLPALLTISSITLLIVLFNGIKT